MKLSKPIVVWCGRQHQLSGYGFAARLHVSALRGVGATVVALDSSTGLLVGSVPEATVEVTQSATGTTIRAVDPDRPIVIVVHDRPDFFPKVTASGRALLIGYSYWETSSVPPGWAGWQTSMDAVWTSSQFNAEIFENAGVPGWMINIVGHPIDPLLLEVRDTIPTSTRRWKESTVFLSVVSSTVGRRDMNLLFESFSAAFSADDDVALVLKVPSDGDAGLQEIYERAFWATSMRDGRRPPSIYVVADQLTREQLVRLHSSVDAYISCERGNGWDLPAMDSLVLGIPVINVGFGASTTFCSSGDTYTVKVSDRLVACEDTMFGAHSLYSGQSWPYVDPQEMARQIRAVFDNKTEAADRGASASDRIRKEYRSEKVADEVLERINGVFEVNVRSNGPAAVTLHRADNAWNEPASAALQQTGISGIRRSLNNRSFASRYDPQRAIFAAKEVAKISLKAAAQVSRANLKNTLSDVLAGSSPTKVNSPTVADGLGKVPNAAVTLWATTREMSKTVRDFDDCVRGATTKFDIEDTATRRRIVWNKLGRPRSPREDREKLNALRNRHAGERIFLLGDSPTVASYDLNNLESEFTFGVNNIHELYGQIDWRPSFYTVLDWKMAACIAQDLAPDDGTVRFFPERFRGMLPVEAETYWFSTRSVGHHIDDQFEPDIARSIPERGSALGAAVQQAFFLGFRTIYVLGIGCSEHVPDVLVSSEADWSSLQTELHAAPADSPKTDPSSISPIKAVDAWGHPDGVDLRRILLQMRKGMERHGGQLVNVGVDGEVGELPRVDFADLF